MENCTHDNKVEKTEKYYHLGHEEIYIYCPDCNKTLFFGWRPLKNEKSV